MLIFNDKNTILFTGAKTASTALHRALAPHADIIFARTPKIKHFSPVRFSDKMGSAFTHWIGENPQTIALIREPIDWLGSWYRYRSRSELIGSSKSTHGISFDSFVRAYLMENPPEYARVGQQSKFLCKKNSTTPLVTQLWQYNGLISLCNYLSLMLDVNIKLEPINCSPKIDLILSRENRIALEKRFELDINLYENAIAA